MELPPRRLIGDTVTGEVEVLSVREDKPIVQLPTTFTNQDDILCLEGTALVYWREIDAMLDAG